MSESLMSTYARLPVRFVRGEGAWLWDTAERRYLDAVSGIAVCGLGHAHPAITEAICQQAHQVIHTSNLYHIPIQEQLAQHLTELAQMESVFFCNSGAEANEAAIKLVRLYAHRRGIEHPTILVTEGSFHGRTLATLTATGNRKAQAGFEPLVQGFVRVPYNDIDAIKMVAANRANIVAMLVEPIQGEGGVIIPDPGYLEQVRAHCDRHGWLLLLDEIQTGLGRTGKLFAYQHENMMPDVMTLAKSLANGVPIGACLARGEAARVFQPGSHGSTFGGNPLACRAALAMLETLATDNLTVQAHERGQQLLKALQQQLADCPHVRNIRGRGLMIGIELDRDCTSLVSAALDAGLLINVTSSCVIRLLPPLIIQEEHIEFLVTQLSQLIHHFTTD
jgi:acetylornithine aminotransferase